MNFWNTITSNHFINVAIFSWITAQCIKVVINLFFTKKIKWERFIGAGGMPSAHSAFTVALTITVARKLGVASAEFALALALSLIVMYDAMGVRRAAGEQAKVLNSLATQFTDFLWPKRDKMIELEVDLEEEEPVTAPAPNNPIIPEKGLKEFLGHTPLEVVAGAILGAVIAFLAPLH